jgi:hypothetical protein
VLGGETFATRLAELLPAERPHLTLSEVADWFATYVYLPKLRDRVVLETAIRDALAKLDPKVAYAEAFEEMTGKYDGLLWQKAPVAAMPKSALLVRPEIAVEQLRTTAPTTQLRLIRHRRTAVAPPNRHRRRRRPRPQIANHNASSGRSRSTRSAR